MKKESRYSYTLRAISRYLTFFALMAFIITCCMMLFVTVLTNTLDITLTSEDLSAAAKLTFLNVLLLSLLCTVLDSIRRKLTIEHPIKEITAAAERIMQGDFTTRIPAPRSQQTAAYFGDIVDCFNKIAEELSGVETLRSDFIANVSHELKTPLSVMKNYATMLKNPAITAEERREYCSAISQAADNLSSLITNILRLNKLENQQICLDAKRYNLGEQLFECLLSFENVLEEKELALDCQIDDEIYVKTDGDMMTLVWNNLLSNAVKFTEQGGNIAVSLEKEGDYAVITVKDSGCGISPEVGAHIFEKFYQGDTSHATRGNGLGLTLVKRVIDITGSEIAVKSEPGVGSVFTVKMKRECHEDS